MKKFNPILGTLATLIGFLMLGTLFRALEYDQEAYTWQYWKDTSLVGFFVILSSVGIASINHTATKRVVVAVILIGLLLIGLGFFMPLGQWIFDQLA